MDDELKEIYFNPALPGSFGGVNALSKVSNRNDVKEWLSGQDAFTLHKPVRRKFKRRRTICVGVDHLWQIDLVDLTSLARHNDGFKCLLTCIDGFSRYAWVVPIKSKHAANVTEAFATLLTDRRPTYAQSDKGSEFINFTFQSFLRSNNIRFYTSENDDIKCALVERFNRTLKTRMWRYFTHSNSLRYVDILSWLVKSYNETVHSSIKMAPFLVTVHNESKLRKKTVRSKPKLTVGDRVRISETRRAFNKGYLPDRTDPNFDVEYFHLLYVYILRL